MNLLHYSMVHQTRYCQMIDPIKTAYIAGYMTCATWEDGDEREYLEQLAEKMYESDVKDNWYKLGEAVDKVTVVLRDAERLNWLNSKGANWICRDSTTGRGWRLHQTSREDVSATVRDAIDNAMETRE
jgi:hypothetical protein